MSTIMVTRDDIVRAYFAAYHKAATEFRGGSVYYDPSEISNRYGWEEVVFHAASGGCPELGEEIATNCQLSDCGDWNDDCDRDEFAESSAECFGDQLPFDYDDILSELDE